MAKLVPTPTGEGPINDFEREVIGVLARSLPDNYMLLPNFSLRQDGRAYEIDLVVLAPHAVYVVEAKAWYGRITGDDTEWLINERHPKKCPLWLADLKCKVLKGFLGAALGRGRVEGVLVVPDGTSNLLGGQWADRLVTVQGLVTFLQDPKAIREHNPPDLTREYSAFVGATQGAWGRRKRGPLEKVGSYDLLETMAVNDDHTEYLAKQAYIDDPARYRVRLWRLSPHMTEAEREERRTVIRRPTQAVASIGLHPNLLRVLAFDELPDNDGFYEVTEWSEFGTLHGYLNNDARDRLTVRERLDIAAGVVRALAAVHAKGVVHRNVCPESILIGFDRQPRLTDFDRAFMLKSGGQSIFGLTTARNPAYVPPELEDVTDYDFTEAADMYAFGVLLYELLVGRPPFASPKAAREAKGAPPTWPSKVRADVPEGIDELVKRCLQVDGWDERPSASEALGLLDRILTGTTGARSTDGRLPPDTDPPGDTFAPGSLVAKEYRVERSLGNGSFAAVYKVLHIQQGRTYAMKVLKQAVHADAMHQEYKVGQEFPVHANIARIIWLGRLPPPGNQLYVLSSTVEGENLVDFANGTKSLPFSEVRRIGIELLDALEVLHADNWLHRDIKPANIMLAPGNRPKLIDFNLSTTTAEAAGAGGTPRYWAPDRGKPEWEPSSDLFSLGVVLYELITQIHPFPNDRPDDVEPHDPATLGLGISDKFAAFLQKAVRPRREDRFSSAAEMRAALTALPTLKAVPPLLVGEPGVGPTDRPNINPFVEGLLTLYSQARRSNAGTRGLDDIARLTYVPTRLDTALRPAILEGQFRLVIVTGNAGDGKTAFLQQVEAGFTANGISVALRPQGNGATWTHEGLRYASNYDGSQDEGDTENDRVLADFLAPFKGEDLSGLSGQEVRLIAINEGRLRDFLDHADAGKAFAGLRQAVTSFFTSEVAPPSEMLIVNLNMRAVAAGAGGSIVERQLAAFLEPAHWAACASCVHHDRCPLRRNAASLGDAVIGRQVRERLRRLFEVIHLRRHLHVTMRDLRSALSYLLLQDTSCVDVAQILVAPDATDRLARLDYTQAYASEHEHLGGTEDRLVRLLRELDVGLVELPGLDRKLHADPLAAVSWMTFEDRSPYGEQVFAALRQAAFRNADRDDLAASMRERRSWMRAWRRRAYFERLDDDWAAQLPYRALTTLENAIQPPVHEDAGQAGEALKYELIEAISLLEGVRHPRVRRENVCLRATRARAATLTSFRLFPAEQFTLRVPARAGLDRFLETAPDAVVLEADEALGRASLRLSLDLIEMLRLVRNGYRPALHDMGGLFVNLTIFRNALLHLPYRAVLVTQDGERFHEIGAETAGGEIRLYARTADPSKSGGRR